MANINLLPWRDDYREKRKKEFLTLLILVLLITFVAAFLWVSSVESSIDSQLERNTLLNQEIAVLQKRVTEIKELKKKRAELLERMKVIQDLQGLRPAIVHSFDEFVRMIPDGIYIVSVEKKDNLISLEGVTESNNRVSSFMRNFDESPWFEEANLNSVDALPEISETASSFSMTVKSAAPEKAGGES